MGQRASKSLVTNVAVAVNKNPATAAPVATVADPISGFYRGQGPKSDSRDLKQQDFLLLRQKQESRFPKDSGTEAKAASSSAIHRDDPLLEMPNDLRQFIQDVGPLRKVPSNLGKKGETSLDESKAATVVPRHQRVRSFMPLVDDDQSNPTSNTNGEAAFITQRTTNFSYTTQYDRDSTINFFSVGGDVHALQQFIRLKYATPKEYSDCAPVSTTPAVRNKIGDMTVDEKSGNIVVSTAPRDYSEQPVDQYDDADVSNVDVDEIVSEYYEARLRAIHAANTVGSDLADPSTDNPAATTQWTQTDHEYHRILLKETLEVLEVPVVLRDTDGSFVASYRHRVQELANMNILPVPTNRVRLIVDDIIAKDA
jgi:hypothetical protein